jgi:hypothetical protein
MDDGQRAQRASSVRGREDLLASMQAPGFQFLWKRKLDSQPLTQPLLLPNIIAYKVLGARVRRQRVGNVYPSTTI